MPSLVAQSPCTSVINSNSYVAAWCSVLPLNGHYYVITINFNVLHMCMQWSNNALSVLDQLREDASTNLTEDTTHEHAALCKQFSIQLHPTYLPTSKICRVELCTELFYAIIPALFLCFLLICFPYILLNF